MQECWLTVLLKQDKRFTKWNFNLLKKVLFATLFSLFMIILVNLGKAWPEKRKRFRFRTYDVSFISLESLSFTFTVELKRLSMWKFETQLFALPYI